jgi:hypothetical protein
MTTLCRPDGRIVPRRPLRSSEESEIPDNQIETHAAALGGIVRQGDGMLAKPDDTYGDQIRAGSGIKDRPLAEPHHA